MFRWYIKLLKYLYVFKFILLVLKVVLKFGGKSFFNKK